ncbi:hypothetical protein [Ruminococcus albus]|uniref:Uncharacterized protein n=1 Tax=Ruminococcus albus (strain ATCC 27210 / DSM 20455 / JCM 14654 / NCDO 2250 / 7) TaxID=697329 RepID=E6UIJ2_RUMA7|nr:hypothetical protein [Ruminococcus albus]ADU23337.1 hypothetical protein Rumal_2871 [Ruminococcus albus 7 = DSM 20455]
MKKAVSGILGVLFVIIVVCGVFVCTYIFNEPNHDKGTDSRQLVLGYWTDEDDDIRFYFDKSGEFKIVKLSDEDHIYAEGWFKVNEKAGKIKLMLNPRGERDTSYDLGEKLKLFSEITYRDLKAEEPYSDKGWTFLSERQRKEIMEAPSSCKFIMSNAKENVYNCERTRTIKEFNGDEKADQRVNDGANK